MLQNYREVRKVVLEIILKFTHINERTNHYYSIFSFLLIGVGKFVSANKYTSLKKSFTIYSLPEDPTYSTGGRLTFKSE